MGGFRRENADAAYFEPHGPVRRVQSTSPQTKPHRPRHPSARQERTRTSGAARFGESRQQRRLEPCQKQHGPPRALIQPRINATVHTVRQAQSSSTQATTGLVPLNKVRPGLRHKTKTAQPLGEFHQVRRCRPCLALRAAHDRFANSRGKRGCSPFAQPSANARPGLPHRCRKRQRLRVRHAAKNAAVGPSAAAHVLRSGLLL
jgi:hypothetical protein